MSGGRGGERETPNQVMTQITTACYFVPVLFIYGWTDTAGGRRPFSSLSQCCMSPAPAKYQSKATSS